MFDSAGRLATQSGSGISGVATYTYQAGKKAGESIPLLGGTISSTFGYNAESRLTTATAAGATDTFSYDLAGNLTRYATGGVARVLSYEAGRLVNVRPEGGSVETAFTHDTLGRRTVRDRIGSSDDSVYFYNQASQMEAFGSSECSATYAYDATGQRLSSAVTSGKATTTTTTFSYEGLTLLSLSASATDGDAWSLAHLYTGDGRPYAAIYSTEATAVPFSILMTDRGDVVALLDAQGQSFASYRYDQWGRPLSTETSGTEKVGATLAAEIASRQVLRYAGYAWDAESSLYYCSARYYDPATMQFLTKDIAKADAEESPYQYCSGDPVGKVDPSGEWPSVIRMPMITTAVWGVSLTSYLMGLFEQNAGFARLVRQGARVLRRIGAVSKLSWWAAMVAPRSPWDIKRRIQPGVAWTFNGITCNNADIGNIHYGYVGRAAGYGLGTLSAGAGVAQLIFNPSDQYTWRSFFDDPRDQEMIRYGYSLYGRTKRKAFRGSIYVI